MRSINRKRLLCSATLIVPLLLAGCSDSTRLFDEDQRAEMVGAGPHELGVYHFQQGHYGLAIQHFERANKKSTVTVESLNGLGASYDQLGRFDLAESYYRRALRLEPQSAQTLNNIGYSYWLQGKYDLALAFLRDADNLDEGNRVIVANRALAATALQEDGLAPASEQLAVAGEEAEPAFQEKRGARIERASVDEQVLVLKGTAVPAAFAGLPKKANATLQGGKVDAAPLSLSYLPSQTAIQVPSAGAAPAKVAQPLSTETALERGQLAAVPVMAVEAVALPPLGTNESPIEAPIAAEVSDVRSVEVAAPLFVPERSFVAAFAPESPARSLEASEPVLLAEMPQEAPVADEAAVESKAQSVDADSNSAISGFLASLVDGIRSFFSASEPGQGTIASVEAYVGPYGTEAGGRHHSLGLAQPDQYAVSNPRIEVSTATGQVEATEPVGY